MSATIHPLPEPVDDERLVIDAAREAVARGLHLVIDRHGRSYLTPQLLPGMVRLAVLDKEAA